MRIRQKANVFDRSPTQAICEQLRQLGRQHIQAARGQRSRELDQVPLVDAARMYAMQQHHTR